MPPAIPSRPIDATLSVTKAARLLGVHPNTIRAWSDAGRLRYYRINPRGDRRYRLGDLQRFLAAAESGLPDGTSAPAPGRRAHDRGRGDMAFGPAARLARAVPLAEPTPSPAAGTPRPPAANRHGIDLDLLVALARIAGAGETLAVSLLEAAKAICEHGPHRAVAVFELRGDWLYPVANAGRSGTRLVELPRDFGVIGAALAAARPEPLAITSDDVRSVIGGRPETAIAIPGLNAGAAAPPSPWGVLVVDAGPGSDPSAIDADLLGRVAVTVGSIVASARQADEIRHQLHRADALRRVAGDIGSRLDLDQILSGLVDHAMVLFEADRGAVFLGTPGGGAVPSVSRGLSQAYLQSVKEFPARSLPSLAVAARRPMFAGGYRDDPRGEGVRAAVVQEGYDTICTAPLFDGPDVLGLLNVYHDSPHVWADSELDTMMALATQASVAIKNAQNYEKMATWAAQLGSIQQLGVRLSRLTSDKEIGLAIATELRSIIDYHNVRVYRLIGDDLIPVAMQGSIGEYTDETPEQLQVKFGEGITGWVAEHRVAQNIPDAAHEPRANTIPGTEDDLDESMLLTPMLFEDQVLGVLVLSKLGLHQFTDDHLRLLVIYASFAAQAFANADATEKLRAQSDALERQLVNQRGLLQVTESILTTLDPNAILDQVADHLANLVGYDNIAIEIVDEGTGLLSPLTARGVHAAEYLMPWAPGEQGLATWVVDHNEPVLVVDERQDPRVNHFREDAMDGSLIVVPLRGREGATGVLTLERLGLEHRYTQDEFELVQLFAAQVSIALQNAEVHQAVEVRAQTDDMTGLLNHGTFQAWLRRSVEDRDPFSLIMLDLDDFKTVNDVLGHQAGDRLLAEIAAAIVAAGRSGADGRASDLLFRYGGDEFALILPGTDAASALAVAERVRTAVHEVGGVGSSWAEAGMHVSTSIGLATFPRDGLTPESILLAADRACFVAKRKGPGLIATADEGLARAREFSLSEPTPVDPPTVD
ncbi:MAG TPA: GAF domain-containing protein [Candidatus Limnocylindrales bacterium]|nr:GAF domain-containing protein [Candidatus Limnocylindrales bacterium]